MVPVLSLSTLLRLQVASKGNFPKWALRCVHFPGLSCSGSGSPQSHLIQLNLNLLPYLLVVDIMEEKISQLYELSRLWREAISSPFPR